MKKLAPAVLVVLAVWLACGGPDSKFDLVIVNTLQSAEAIQVDLGGDARSLDLGESTLFTSVSKGDHVFSIQGTLCSGTVRDTVNVLGDTTIRFTVKPDSVDGSCSVRTSITVVTARPVAPTGVEQR